MSNKVNSVLNITLAQSVIPNCRSQIFFEKIIDKPTTGVLKSAVSGQGDGPSGSLGGAAEAATEVVRVLCNHHTEIDARCHTEVVVAATKKAATVVAVTVHHEGVNNLDILS